MATYYRRVLLRVVQKKIITAILFIVPAAGVLLMSRLLPTSFIPTEDQGMIYLNITLPPGATVDRTQEILDDLAQVCRSENTVQSVSTLAGYSLLTESSGPSYGMGMISLKPWHERSSSVNQIIEKLKEKSSDILDAKIQFFPPPAVPGYGNAGGFELRMLDHSALSLDHTSEVAKTFVDSLNRRVEIQNAFSSFDSGFPQFQLHIDEDRAMQLGITIRNAMETLQSMVGSLYVSNFIRFGQMYKVMIQTSPQFRSKPSDLLQLYAKNAAGEMVPFSSFMTIERVSGPEQITRYNMFTAAMINGEAAPGFSSGDAIRAVEETAATALPKGYSVEWSGVTREETSSGNQVLVIFFICIFFVYMLLAAQYESYRLPLCVILSLPAGVFGSYLFLKMAGLENNIYAQVALVMLIGLLGKNAILIIEFAVLKRREGKSIIDSAIDGAVARLRPILMTSFAFIAGMIPLCVASGAGAIGNRSIGTAAAGGMLVGTLFGLFLVPGIYVLVESLSSGERKIKETVRHQQNIHGE